MIAARRRRESELSASTGGVGRQDGWTAGASDAGWQERHPGSFHDSRSFHTVDPRLQETADELAAAYEEIEDLHAELEYKDRQMREGEGRKPIYILIQYTVYKT